MTVGSLRILVACDWFSPCTGGGAERVAFEVVSRLAERGHRVAVLATVPRGGEPFTLPAGVDLSVVRAHSLAGLTRAQIGVAPSLPVRADRAVGALRPDVVWGHSLQFQTTPFVALAARRRRIPLVVTAHIADLEAVPGAVGLAARAHEATVGRAILRSATRCIAVSDAVAAHVRRLDRRVPVDVVPNGVDLRRFRPDMAARSDRLRAGFLGRLVPNKGPDVAVRAVAEAARAGLDVSLSVAGDGPDRAPLERLAVGLGIADRVRFDGFVVDPERWLREIDVLIRPSTTEGMPLAVLEALAAGVAIVASDVPGNRALLRDGESALLVAVRDIHAVAGALLRIERDPLLRSRLALAGPKIAAAYSWDATAESTLASLSRAITMVRSRGRMERGLA